jgi:uracil phosphoribosyltransferase
MAGMAMSLRVVVPPHPLIAHWLCVLRDPATPSPLVGTALQQLGRWLSYEAVRDWLPQQAVAQETPQGRWEGFVVDPATPVLAIPLLPAGLGLWEGAREVLPAAALAPLLPSAEGLAFDLLPGQLGQRVGVLVFTAQIASGESLLRVVMRLRDLGVEGPRLRVITTLAAAPGLKLLGEQVPNLTLYCACIDPELDAQGALVPGIGEPQRRFTGFTPGSCLG